MIQAFTATAKIPTPKQQQMHIGTATQIITRTMNPKNAPTMIAMSLAMAFITSVTTEKIRILTY